MAVKVFKKSINFLIFLPELHGETVLSYTKKIFDTYLIFLQFSLPCLKSRSIFILGFILDNLE